MDTQTTNSVSLGSALGAFIATLGVFAIVFAIAWWILQVVAYWKIFTKAGKPGWHSIIPVLSDWDKIDLSWSRTWAWVMLVLMVVTWILSYTGIGVTVTAEGEVVRSGFWNTISYIVSIAALIIGLVSEYKLAKAFGKGFGFFLGLLFLNPIFKLILGFGDARYLGRQDGSVQYQGQQY